MKQIIHKSDFDILPLNNQLFLTLWRKEKGYSLTKEWSFGEAVELALALTQDLHFEAPAERTTFNNALHYNEINIGWDGSEPLDILWYELNQKLKHRITQHLVIKNKD